jgi:ferritin-like metal-binding protein YciE
MPEIDSVKAMLIEEVRGLYDAEQRLTTMISDLVDASTNEELSGALERHLTETHQHIARLETVFEALGARAHATPCVGIKGIIEEAERQIDERFETDTLRDVAIIGAAQRAEHYEMAAYGTAIAHARQIGLEYVAQTLEETLDEEKAADRALTGIAEGIVNPEAASQESGVATRRASSLD